jgi:hypothetical protein
LLTAAPGAEADTLDLFNGDITDEAQGIDMNSKIITRFPGSIRSVLLAVGACAASMPAIAFAADAQPPLTVAQYIAQVSYEAPRHVVSYCVAQVPTMKAPLEAELDRYEDKLEFAAAAAAHNLGLKMDDPVPPGMQDALDSIDSTVSETVRKSDPQTYCKGVLPNLQKTTAEQLRMTIESAFADYQTEANGKPAGAAKP